MIRSLTIGLPIGAASTAEIDGRVRALLRAKDEVLAGREPRTLRFTLPPSGPEGEAEIGVYSVSKAALIMLSNMLAIEGARRGVRSNAVCPGDTVPGMRHMVVPGEDERPDDPSSWDLPPIGRLGEAADVAEAVRYLASHRAAFVNGVALLVDGGMRAGMRTATPPD